MRIRRLLWCLLALVVGACGSCYPGARSLGKNAPTPGALGNPAGPHNRLLRDSADCTTCYVDVIGQPTITTAGELGLWFRRLAVDGARREVRIVHPIRATLIVSRRDRCYLFTLDYEDPTQTDPAQPPAAAILSFLGVAKTLCAGEDPHFAMQIGLLIAWTDGPQSSNEGEDF